MRPVYMVSGGITKFKKASVDKDFRYMVKEAFDYATNDVPNLRPEMIDGSARGNSTSQSSWRGVMPIAIPARITFGSRLRSPLTVVRMIGRSA